MDAEVWFGMAIQTYPGTTKDVEKIPYHKHDIHKIMLRGCLTSQIWQIVPQISIDDRLQDQKPEQIALFDIWYSISNEKISKNNSRCRSKAQFY